MPGSAVIRKSWPASRYWQGVFARPDGLTDDQFERDFYVTRRFAFNAVIQAFGERDDFYPVSMSARTVAYYGMFLADQLGPYYPDLSDERFESALAMVHQRFSTNIFPSWKLAHP